MILHSLNAFEELSLPRLTNELLPVLLNLGLEPDYALAVANNCATLYFMLGKHKPGQPIDILKLYSLTEIIALLEDQQHFDETGENVNFKQQVTNNESI